MTRKVTRTIRCSKYSCNGVEKLIPVTQEKENPSIIRDLYDDGYCFVDTVNVKYTLDEETFFLYANAIELGEKLNEEDGEDD